MYCLTSDVERYITLNVGADVEGAILDAQARINLYTGDFFESLELTIYCEGNRVNVIDLPYTTQSIASVTAIGSETPLTENAWSFQQGGRPFIRIFPEAAWSILIAGFEPYNVSARPSVARVNVAGVFGTPSVPTAIREATAILAASFLAATGQGTLTSGAESNLGAPNDVSSITVEGYAVTYRENGSNPSDAVDSTGLTSVDRMVAPYRRTKRARIF